MDTYSFTPIARIHTDFSSKFGIPRQSGLVKGIVGEIVFTPSYRHEEAVRGLEAFDYLWLIWEFSENRQDESITPPPSTLHNKLTVRPPRLGGNKRVGVFASRSPFRPNNLGLSCVYIKEVKITPSLGPVIVVDGADLMDGTPIYDIKPYVVYADSHPEARSGFVDQSEWNTLEVLIPEQIAAQFTVGELEGLRQLLALDPRPRYHDDAGRIYGMPFAGRDIRFKVDGNCLEVIGLS